MEDDEDDAAMSDAAWCRPVPNVEVTDRKAAQKAYAGFRRKSWRFSTDGRFMKYLSYNMEKEWKSMETQWKHNG